MSQAASASQAASHAVGVVNLEGTTGEHPSLGRLWPWKLVFGIIRVTAAPAPSANTSTCNTGIDVGSRVGAGVGVGVSMVAVAVLAAVNRVWLAARARWLSANVLYTV